MAWPCILHLKLSLGSHVTLWSVLTPANWIRISWIPIWIIAPTTPLAVPWIWICALGTAWERYQTEGGTLGQAFGLEGGQGKPPISDKLAQMLDERAIARWVFSRVQEARAVEKRFRIEGVIQQAATKFGKSDVTIRRAWARFGRRERQRQSK